MLDILLSARGKHLRLVGWNLKVTLGGTAASEWDMRENRTPTVPSLPRVGV